MRAYYRYLLPWKSLFTWLNHDMPQRPSKLWTHREFAFTLQNDAYLRYISVPTAAELQKEVVRLNPSRFEIGPVYSAQPKDRKRVKTLFRPVARELVFDIDMTDYDEIRTCCSGGGICRRCWGFIAVAVKVLDDALRSDFGLKHLLWVYSGRRGIHCWVSDQAAMELTDDQRRAIVGWLSVIQGSGHFTKKVNLGADLRSRALHPALRRALGSQGQMGVLSRAFTELILQDQDCFRSEKGWRTLLQLLPKERDDKGLLAKLENKWERTPSSSLEKWREVMDMAAKEGWIPYCEDIILQYTYPRIDTEVSKHMNHLLKSPFVIHPSTGRVCVPLDAKTLDRFDPETCPTVAQLLREQDNFIRRTEAERRGVVDPNVHAWDHTSLKPYVDLFDRHCQAIVRETDAVRRAQLAQSVDF